ncbi:hypothetical protein DYB28_009292 [Aphanomyces astaci]|uniref:Uncharacterized protein n=1 Tax=Aphanomyces astaci TaxID=112090 RepID=A0A9X8DYR5_APHAT|nr:hypothetical protein DYB28_009292 [Aphanomyces astaci]
MVTSPSPTTSRANVSCPLAGDSLVRPTWDNAPLCAWPSVDVFLTGIDQGCAACNPFDSAACPSNNRQQQYIPVPTSPYSSCDTVPSRATVDISVYDRHGSIVTPTLHATDTVPWRDYALGDRRPSILYSLLHSGSKQQLLPGRYDVHLEAHDGFSTSAVCSTCVTVSDRFRPQSQRGSCPFTGDSSVFQFVGWSAHASGIRAISSHLNAFVTSRQNNDACGDVLDDNNVIACDDVINVTVSDWLNCPVDADYLDLAGVSSSSGNHCVRAALIRNPFVDTTVLADPASFLSPLQCTRTSYVSYQWREVWLDYTCDNAAATAICSSGADIAPYRGGDLSDATLDQVRLHMI